MKKIYLTLLLITACFLGGITMAHGQIVKGVLKTTVNHFRSLDLEGTWSYEGAAIQFKSESLLTKAGGKVASSQMEKKLNKQLKQVGFQPGVTTFEFKEGGKFTQTTKGTSMKGTYELDDDNNITLKYANHIPVKAKISGTGDKVSMLFEANGFLSIVTFVGSHSGISVIKSITSLLNSYDGMMVGLELKRK